MFTLLLAYPKGKEVIDQQIALGEEKYADSSEIQDSGSELTFILATAKSHYDPLVRMWMMRTR